MLTQRPYCCGNCTHFLDQGDGQFLRPDIENWKRMGQCRKIPPSMEGKWPPVKFLDWCGEHPSAPMNRTQQLLAMVAAKLEPAAEPEASSPSFGRPFR